MLLAVNSATWLTGWPPQGQAGTIFPSCSLRPAASLNQYCRCCTTMLGVSGTGRYLALLLATAPPGPTQRFKRPFSFPDRAKLVLQTPGGTCLSQIQTWAEQFHFCLKLDYPKLNQCSPPLYNGRLLSA